MKVLHFTYDYPDAIKQDKTQAIKNIIEVSAQPEQSYCISLNRTANFKKKDMLRHDNVTALSTFGLPKGIFFSWTLRNSIERVLDVGLDIKAFDMIHAHKLTFEGPIAYHIHKKEGTPYIITIQHTDFKVLKYKPLMRRYYFGILQGAKQIILVSPWMEVELYKMFGNNRMEMIKHKLQKMPLVVENKISLKEVNNDRFLCVFHMRNTYIKIKNIYRVLKAISILKESGTYIKLDIAGDGIAKHRVDNMIKKLNLDEQVKMIGKIDNKVIVDVMSDYKAFILCSYPETFGMVYVEALSAGIPIIYTKNAGIDGFFNDKEVGIAVNHESVKEICDALIYMNTNFNRFKKNVGSLQKKEYLKIFSREYIKQKYNSILGA